MNNPSFLGLFLQMKNNPIQDKSPVHGDDFVILPEPRTAISISSKDTMNVTVSQCSLNVFYNLAKVGRTSPGYNARHLLPPQPAHCVFIRRSLRPQPPPSTTL